ncbi:protein OS-9 [Fistulifera solaris]|uniref:Protein OS-9 n=1 Tax=Fistulifera solaris TaxID=1519565 RepID=A0A1Z5KB55_FISSO|nr:protein OS-9 [Fistulifera solaris]|eukprot:GAX23375.1 protein OS-9 [Fistulifera solaris]
MTFNPAIYASLFLFLLYIPLTHSGHLPFPFDAASHEEYDPNIFDPHSGSGAPYGGFSRATQSRLAKLPLFVSGRTNHHHDDDTKTDDDLFFMPVTDRHGQSYVCRFYSEDELLPESLTESMFVPPKLNTHPLSPSTTTSSNNDDDEETPSSLHTRQLPQYDQTDPTDDLSTEERKKLSYDDQIVSVQVLLAELEGICGQRHTGDWWSYEWCYEGSMSQFHVRLRSKRSTPAVAVEEVSSLGKFHARTTFVENLNELEPRNNMLGERKELARVVDEYRNGELCTEAGQHRKSYVHLMCCSQKFLDKGKGMLHRNGNKLDTTIASLTNIVEEPTCTYNVTVCTSLLCVNEDDDDDNSEEPVGMFQLGSNQKMSLAITGLSLAAQFGSQGTHSSQFPVGSVRDILDKALGNRCLTSSTGPWWTYEFCHMRRVRQFHEEIVSEKTSSGGAIMLRRIDTEHILGLYDSALGEIHLNEDWKLVHNSTDPATQATSSASSGVGNGAFFEIEYPGGDVCDHTDVTDAAIVAGSAGVGGVERSSSIRYSCGSAYAIAVNEDTTCHYLVHVQVPELCAHPLFMAPVSKKQVVKCLPV